MMEPLTLTFDKSHIITIGERLYAQSIELVRELVNNAYDADATSVDVTIGEDMVVVRDDGRGMDMGGLRQYFSVGSPEKLHAPRSPRFGRDRIGQFGIGKFASLAAASRFEVSTQCGTFAARAVFDREQWESSENWHIPLERIEPDPARGDGTTVVLSKLTRQFDLEDVEDCIVSGVPLKAPNFGVHLNGYQVTPRSWSGQSLAILEGTEFGQIHGEVVILPESGNSSGEMGIECKVKGAMIRRETFGIESWGMPACRIRGEVNADFLPITSDRTGFITDSPEYAAFREAMARVMTEVRQVLSRLSDRKENRRASRALNEALDRVWNSIVMNPECSPFGAVPIGDAGLKGGAAALPRPHECPNPSEDGKVAADAGANVSPAPSAEAALPQRLMKKPQKIKKLTPNALVKRMKFGKHKISCCLDHFGDGGPDAFSEGTIIYINRDHPLYLREMKRAWSYTMYVSRLLTQEIALMKEPRSAKKAFELQSRLLRGAFISAAEKQG